MNNDKTYLQAIDELHNRLEQKIQENTTYPYSPDEPIWYHRGPGSRIQATFKKYNPKTVTIIVHFKHAGDCRQYVKVDQISPRNTGGNT